ncbi:enoyl-CoA hydratase/isomerase family protein [Arthrobacter sp. SO3]|uniref:enoyl-CoA hydratase/isomerase family protein n=1 Tax=Arthrobacter sp. SO3 TaxID=1897057 RepID=UPI001CFF8352|nr:enoyl-CoA hydratase-related protein [Arthrobacter sp. SO3]MCB5293733.1 2,3-dehydroadipyl-CoA hydratase [Arthrobacter sp. SO3]
MFIESTLDNSVLTIVFNDAARRNAMGDRMRGEFVTALENGNADSSVRTLLVRGAGGNFCSGGDLTAMPPENLSAARDRLAQVAGLVRQLCGFTKPTIAVVEGAAAGLGASLALACDYVYMAEDARLMLPFSRLGLLPDGGILHSLGARIGVTKARQLLLEGRTVGAEECLRLGLADFCYRPDQLAEEAAARAGNLAAAAPLSVAGVKRALAEGLPSLEDALASEHSDQPACYFSSDFAEGKRAIAQRGLPVFTGF